MSTDASPRTLHIVPGRTACGSLRRALASVGCDEDVLAFEDDLSCGPIDPDDPHVREIWWGCSDTGFTRGATRPFWRSVEASSAKLILWFSRHSVADLSLFLHFADRLGDRPYAVLDITGQNPAYRGADGRSAVSEPLRAVVGTRTEAFPALLGTERALTDAERAQARDRWRRLKAENSHFRVITDDGLTSAPEGHFDATLIDCAGRAWTKSARVVGDCLARVWKPYVQVHDVPLARRLVALVEAGHLQGRGDLSDMRASEVRLPGETALESFSDCPRPAPSGA